MTKERILQYIDFKGISKTIFFQETDIKRGLLDADKINATVSDVVLAKILATYPDLNLEWLITGKGEMLKDDSLKSGKNDVKLWSVIESQQRTIEQNANTIASLTQQLAQRGDAAGVSGVAPATARG